MPATSSRRVAVIAEGYGDCDAVVDLLAKAAKFAGVDNLVFEKPVIRGGGIKKIINDAERLAAIATYRDTEPDFLIVVTDCDDGCPVENAISITHALTVVKQKRNIVGGAVCLLVKEYESIFLAGLHGLKAKLPETIGDFDDNTPRRCEEYRDAKGRIAAISKYGYKPTRDQRSLTKALDCAEVVPLHRSFRHLLSALKWMANSDPATRSVYPTIATH